MTRPGGRPRKVRRCDVLYTIELRNLGHSWKQIAEMLGYVPGTLRSAASAVRKTGPGPPVGAGTSDEPPGPGEPGREVPPVVPPTDGRSTASKRLLSSYDRPPRRSTGW